MLAVVRVMPCTGRSVGRGALTVKRVVQVAGLVSGPLFVLGVSAMWSSKATRAGAQQVVA